MARDPQGAWPVSGQSVGPDQAYHLVFLQARPERRKAHHESVAVAHVDDLGGDAAASSCGPRGRRGFDGGEDEEKEREGAAGDASRHHAAPPSFGGDRIVARPRACFQAA